MAKLLDGRELAGFIKQRHFKAVSAMAKRPGLAIIAAGTDPASLSYVRTKERYGADIGVRVEVHQVKGGEAELLDLIERLNRDDGVTGIIVQLPLPDQSITDRVIAAIEPVKDVDGLGPHAKFDPATPLGILWLLASNNIELKDKEILLVGHGRLVGRPLERMLKASGLKPKVADIETKDLQAAVKAADIVISATGRPLLIEPAMLKPGAVVVDAGIAKIDGELTGDVDPRVYEMDDVTVTPVPGGVGPMTVAALFDNLIRAAA
jgi:methylenetetrahydrofolate dehydrogenase (NADP+)/methenyltetrahydrofolate cyclohydrolase